jgi:DNA gyrase subunit B
MTDNNSYNADNITVLEGLEAVRKRPAMYIGNTDYEGLHKIFGEILDNSIDEYMAGVASDIHAVIEKDGTVIVADNGRGIPVDIHPKTGKPALETIMTVLHAGGKFDQKNYQFSGGLHGVGASVTNALSSYLGVWVLRDEEVFYLSFKKGKTQGEMVKMTLEQFAKDYPDAAAVAVWKKTGTITKFIADKSIFANIIFDGKYLAQSLRETSYLASGIKIHFEDRNADINTKYYFPNGLTTYLEHLTKGEELVTPLISFNGKSEEDKFELDVVLAYSTNFTEKLYAYTNNIRNDEGGMHVTGFKSAMTKLFNKYASEKNIFKKDEKFSPEDIREGLRVIISVRMVDPQFTSQAKVKLGSVIARSLCDKITVEMLGQYFEENPAIAVRIISKAQLAMKARLAAKAARESVMRKGVLESMALPGKLADCSSKDPKECEIFIVEGDSAGGTAKMARNREVQAILPLRGKVLNTERASLDRIMGYEGIKNMILAFGTGVRETFDIERLRYHKIILMTDADTDGAHIATLLLTFLYRYMPELILNGHIYLARPPLFKVAWTKKKFAYVYSDEEKDAMIAQLQEEFGDKVKIEIQRYKGLGEMNADQLWDTTMDPAVRMLYQVQVGDAVVANAVFDELMGDEVQHRKDFIEANAQYADVDL